jgi:heme-degrading monooxygenase HmoA
MEETAQYVALTSLIPPKSRASTRRLFKGSRAVAKQLSESTGVVGFSMLARPLKKEYATLSLWVDEEALAAFARSAPHARLREGLVGKMAPTTFVQWVVAGSDGVPTWTDAFARLGQSAPIGARPEQG